MKIIMILMVLKGAPLELSTPFPTMESCMAQAEALTSTEKPQRRESHGSQILTVLCVEVDT